MGIINSYLGEFDFFLEGCNALFFGNNLSADIGRIVGTHGYIGGGSNRRRLLPQRRTGYICTGGKGFGKAKAGPFLLRRCRRICCLGDVPLEKRLLLLIIRSHRSEGRWYAICRGHDSCLLGSVAVVRVLRSVWVAERDYCRLILLVLRSQLRDGGRDSFGPERRQGNPSRPVTYAGNGASLHVPGGWHTSWLLIR